MHGPDGNRGDSLRARRAAGRIRGCLCRSARLVDETDRRTGADGLGRGARPFGSHIHRVARGSPATRREIKQGGTTDAAAFNPVREAYLPHYRAQVLARAQSAAQTTRPFAERLVHFWANHFAVSADKGAVVAIAGTLEGEAVRPHVNGRFVELLTAVEQHPAMIAFLDNQSSVGKDSALAQAAARRAAMLPRGPTDPEAKPRREFGINENLGREIMELHTLGVHGGYTQADVTTFAQIITGWSIGGGKGRLAAGVPGRFYFRDNLHEPGPKTFMGKTYRESGVRQGEAVLADLAVHPSTARFIATKLVRHFVADDPPESAVERVTRAFLKSGGDLPHVYAALIECPQIWDADMRKYKTPEDFVFSTLRALDVTPRDPQEVIRTFDLLGQRQFTPGSPAGWPDTAKGWDGSGCAHASRALGVSSGRALRARTGAHRSCGRESRRLRAAGDHRGAQSRVVAFAGDGASPHEPRIPAEIAMASQQAALSRRVFLQGIGALAAGTALPGVLFAHTGGNARLVVVILRGALDGLAAVPPISDPAYAPLRRELAIAAPGSADGALRLDGAFGLHPALGLFAGAIRRRWRAGRLLMPVALSLPASGACISTGRTCSRTGLTQPIGSADGWLNRALASLPARGRGGERAVAISQNVPLILRGDRARDLEVAADLAGGR